MIGSLKLITTLEMIGFIYPFNAFFFSIKFKILAIFVRQHGSSPQLVSTDFFISWKIIFFLVIYKEKIDGKQGKAGYKFARL